MREKFLKNQAGSRASPGPQALAASTSEARKIREVGKSRHRSREYPLEDTAIRSETV
jgi:hypothetical protein